MTPHGPLLLLQELVGLEVVLDLRSEFVCLGTLVGMDEAYFAVTDADMHDLRDSAATRETYVYDSLRLGIRRNRARVLIRRDEVVALTRFRDISES